MGYTKLFDSMWSGSLYGKFEASAVFMVLLSLSDSEGQIDMTPEAIAGRTGWPLDFIQEGIRQLEEPDPRSRTPDADGRRIIRIVEARAWGWFITNHEKYREEMRSIERREYLREAKRRERAKRRQQLSTGQPPSTAVNPSEAYADQIRSESEGSAEGRGPRASARTATRLPEDFELTEPRRAYAVSEAVDPQRTFSKFTDHWKAASGAKARKLDWDAAWRNWCRTEAERGGLKARSTEESRWV
jgi:hypothetical protein